MMEPDARGWGAYFKIWQAKKTPNNNKMKRKNFSSVEYYTPPPPSAPMSHKKALKISTKSF